jgi:hypothetical protein
MGRACGTHGEKRTAYRVLVGKSEGKRPLGRPECRWEYSIKMDVTGTEWGGMDWIHPAQDWGQWTVLVNTVMNVWIPENVGKFSSN